MYGSQDLELRVLRALRGCLLDLLYAKALGGSVEDASIWGFGQQHRNPGHSRERSSKQCDASQVENSAPSADSRGRSSTFGGRREQTVRLRGFALGVLRALRGFEREMVDLRVLRSQISTVRVRGSELRVLRALRGRLWLPSPPPSLLGRISRATSAEMTIQGASYCPRRGFCAAAAASRLTGRPSTNTCLICIFSSNRSPSVTRTFATLPGSSEPTRSAAPAMVAA